MSNFLGNSSFESTIILTRVWRLVQGLQPWLWGVFPWSPLEVAHRHEPKIRGGDHHIPYPTKRKRSNTLVHENADGSAAANGNDHQQTISSAGSTSCLPKSCLRSPTAFWHQVVLLGFLQESRVDSRGYPGNSRFTNFIARAGLRGRKECHWQRKVSTILGESARLPLTASGRVTTIHAKPP